MFRGYTEVQGLVCNYLGKAKDLIIIFGNIWTTLERVRGLSGIILLGGGTNFLIN